MFAYETEALATEAETKAFSVETEAKDIQSRGRGETEAFENFSTEARPS